MKRRIKYDNVITGEPIFIEVYWPDGTGLIPPPEIVFQSKDRSQVFVYAGSEE